MATTFEDGYDARKNGLPQSANPHPRDTDAGIAWDTGWTSADQDAMMDDLEKQQARRMRHGDDFGGQPVRRGQWGTLDNE